jgi:NADPH:quinone reductase-like Zn-dependent oxidoreductase
MGADRMLLSEAACRKFSNRCCSPASYHELEEKKARFFIASINRENLTFLKDLVETGKVTPVIDRRYPLSDAADALRYLEQRHAQGKVVLTVENSTAA